jgi:hypothetical protein
MSVTITRVAISLVLGLGVPIPAMAQAFSPHDLTDHSLEDLMNVHVTSVSKWVFAKIAWRLWKYRPIRYTSSLTRDHRERSCPRVFQHPVQTMFLRLANHVQRSVLQVS